ncbi:MAG TPA: hypothetical protein VEA63_01730 [Opitutus sp.]|nr:hypothetical protein [Opitutus sp.]
MPLVIRQKMVTINTNNGKTPTDVTIYVEPKDVLPTDRVVKPTPRQLRELAEQYPEYRGEAAKLQAEDGLSGKQFALLPWDKAVAVVDSTVDEKQLASWFAHEIERQGGPRKSVLDEFAKKGYTQ